ncbi:MAG: GNAT family N-acetyltransferase [Nocardioides sp.]
MSRVNEHGQPVGDPVDWAPRRPPDRVRLPGRHVTVEPLAAGHAEALWAALCSPEDDALWTYRADEPPTSLPAMQEWVDAWNARTDSLTYALVPTDPGTAAGVASFSRIDPDQGSIEVASVLYARSLQRTRAATEAIRLLAGYVFDDLGYRRFEWKLDALNAPSAAAARRLGFRYEGRFRHAMVYKGRNRDTDWFAMTDDDWRSLRPAYDAWLARDNFDDAGQQRTRLSELTAR